MTGDRKVTNEGSPETRDVASLFVAPSILAADFGALRSEITAVENGGADWLHIDVMDGHFVPPITFGDTMVRMARGASKLFLDVHLMITHPERQIESFVAAGADRLIVHQEVASDLRGLLAAIKQRGIANGVAINPATPVAAILDVIDSVDLLLIMTVNPGWGGQKFISSCLDKISEAAEAIARRKAKTIIEVDGGINPETARLCFAAGARALVAGSSIFGVKDRAAAIRALRVA